jgi:hypothetical protein
MFYILKVLFGILLLIPLLSILAISSPALLWRFKWADVERVGRFIANYTVFLIPGYRMILDKYTDSL